MSNKLILNEKKFVENFLTTRQLQDDISIYYLSKLLCRYFMSVDKDMNADAIKYKIIDLVKNLNQNKKQEYILDKEIQKIVETELELEIKLKEFDYIPIYQNELDIIKTCEKDRQKKFMFTCFVLSNYYNREWLSTPYKDLFKLSNISLSNKDRLLFISELYDNKYIDISYSNTNNSIKINKPKETSDVAIKIYDIDNLGNKLLSQLKDGYALCEHCGRMIKIKSKTKKPKYCTKCKEIVDREKAKERMKSLRNG